MREIHIVCVKMSKNAKVLAFFPKTELYSAKKVCVTKSITWKLKKNAENLVSRITSIFTLEKKHYVSLQLSLPLLKAAFISKMENHYVGPIFTRILSHKTRAFGARCCRFSQDPEGKNMASWLREVFIFHIWNVRLKYVNIFKKLKI